MNTSTDRIERQIVIHAPRAKVWKALTTAEEFGKWFGVALDGQSFAARQRTLGRVTYPGYEHIEFEVFIERMEPEQHFAWRWHPFAVDPNRDYSHEPTTLVSFDLQEIEGGTLLKVVESGFDQIPPDRRLEAFRMNSGGWEEQTLNIQKYVTAE